MPAIYWRVTQPAVRRALSLQDGNPASATFGCCHRAFWHYKTLASFPAATMQQLALPFAVLFTTPFDGNHWHGDPEMFDRARGAMLFWSRAQHPSGAVDEWYRNENSYCATAFTTFGVADAYARLQADLGEGDRDVIRRALQRAAAWLRQRFNDQVMNQNLAAAAAFWTLHRLDGDAAHAAAFRRTWERTLQRQDDEGWFLEYGGADAGYGLLALDLIAALHQCGCEEAKPAASRLSAFLSSLAVGEGALAGRLGSRGTEHCFAFGAELFAPQIAAARTLAQHTRRSLEAHAATDPQAVDDRYLAYFYLPSFVSASTLPDCDLAQDARADNVSWKTSGFRVWRDRAGGIVWSTRRCGAFTLHASPRPVHSNLGFWIEMDDGRRFATCAWNDEVTVVEDGEGLRVAARCVRVDDSLPLAKHDVMFRAATQWLFKSPFVAERFHRFIKRRKIVRRPSGPYTFARTLVIRGDATVVRDELRAIGGGGSARAVVPATDVDVHSPSARLRGASRQDAVRVPRDVVERWADLLNGSGTLTVVTRYEPDDDGRLKVASITGS